MCRILARPVRRAPNISANIKYCQMHLYRRPGLAGLAGELSRHWRALGRTLSSRKLIASFQPKLPSPLTPSKLHALDVVAEQGGLRIGDLAHRIGLDETTAARLVDRLETGA